MSSPSVRRCSSVSVRVVREAPARLRVHDIRERVDDGIEVGRDVEAEELFVVGRVADDRDRGRIDDIDQPAQEFRRANAAREDSDHLTTKTIGPEGQALAWRYA